ncbi:uncharacterized protein LOC121376929 [Gigantopelta aegis]|uniref:uncharacterized protein LOC121376929 n=1 Tax=Gigantopelta aegis TaxID=1735272 RepID=UPI001B88788A|nr:uncharacterized protein LOC121376929 [Gigantopelta aegis]
MATTVCSVLGLLCGVLSLTFNVISIATPHWLWTRGQTNFDVGIFWHCDLDENYCGDMESLGRFINPRDIVWFRTVQAAFVIAVVGSLLGAIMSFLSHIKFFESSGTYKTLTIVNIMTMSVELVSLVLFGLDYTDMFGVDGHIVALNWSFHLAITSTCFTFLAVVFHAMEASRAADLIINMQKRLTVWSTPYTLFIDQDP